MPWLLQKRYRHLQRYRKISEVLLRHGFGYLIQQLDLTHFLPLSRRLRSLEPEKNQLTIATRIRLVLEELGPTFIKFGQLLSTRQDMIPPHVLSELEKLQDDVPTIPFEQIRMVIEQELGAKLSDLFASFKEEPIAAASIGQVHRATLANGRQVVVKVRRPGIRKTIDTDLEILYGLAQAVRDKVPRDVLDPVELVEEFSRVIRGELDLIREGRNIQRFARNFEDNPDIIIPHVYWEFSASGVLTMEYIDGYKVSRLASLREAGIDLNELAKTISQAFVKQVFEDGVFHGDPHPGNILVTKQGKVAFLDFGMVGHIDEQTMQGLSRLLVGVTQRNIDEVVQVLADLEAFTKSPNRRLKADIAELIDMHYGKSLKELDFPEVIDDLLGLVRRHPIRLPDELLLLVKAFVTVEGLASKLAPDFNGMEVIEPFASRWVFKHYSPKSVFKRGVKGAEDWVRFVYRLPSELESLIHVVQDGELQIHFRHEGLEKLLGKLDIISNRLTAGIIIAALIVGSSLLVMIDQGPRFMQLPIIGVVGFLIAGFIGLWLMISIFRSGRF